MRTFWIKMMHDCPTLRQLNMPHQPPDSPFYVEAPWGITQWGYGRCPQWGSWLELNGDEEVVAVEQVAHLDVGKWAEAIPEPGPPLVVGCWVDTGWGEAVVTEVTPRCIYIRYRANRTTHGENREVTGYEGKDIWVANGENPWECRFLRPPDIESLRVLALQGPYGVG